MCGGEPDERALRLTVTFLPGPHGSRSYAMVPRELRDWLVCGRCVEGPAGKLLRVALADEFLEVRVPDAPPSECRAVCVSGGLRARGRWRRFWSPRQGSIGPALGRCPVCFGPCEVGTVGAGAAG